MAPRGGEPRQEITELTLLLGRVLRKRRKSKGLKLGQVGAKFGVSAQMVSKYEHGVDPGIGFVVVLAGMLDCSWFDIYDELHFQERLARAGLPSLMSAPDEDDDN